MRCAFCRRDRVEVNWSVQLSVYCCARCYEARTPPAPPEVK